MTSPKEDGTIIPDAAKGTEKTPEVEALMENAEVLNGELSAVNKENGRLEDQIALGKSKLELTPERLKKMSTLETLVKADFSPLLEKLNQDIGVALEARTDGFHLTIVSPTEAKVIANLSSEQVAELQQINADIQRGIGVSIAGIGYIDGSTDLRARKADLGKKTAFIAMDIPAIQKFRESVGLPSKDLHITLGFVGGDIHMEKNGVDEKGKEVVRPISKKADPGLERLRDLLPPMTIEGLTGGEKQEKQKEDPGKLAEKERENALKKALSEAQLDAKALTALGVKPGPELGKLLKAIEKSFNEGGDVRSAPENIQEELQKRIRLAREKNESASSG